ncbi:MAG: hypothetical protein JNM80_01915 [Phycisphaerae bacterium]|nr:hypothetical protein [Phycisphaerae bacterium]
MALLARLYARRIVNVNINIIAAGVAAMLLTIIPVTLTRTLGIDTPWIIMAVAFISDVIFDVAIYYFLHWLANHWPHVPWAKHHDPHKKHLTYFQDATIVQVERMVLGPVYYGIAAFVLHRCLVGGVHREVAAIAAFCSGLATTRVLHTIYMVWNARRAAERRRQQIAAPPASPPAAPPASPPAA